MRLAASGGGITNQSDGTSKANSQAGKAARAGKEVFCHAKPAIMPPLQTATTSTTTKQAEKTTRT
jgi:hypothetical protein